MQSTCYHCGLPVPDTVHLTVHINGQPRPMCCAGCQAVAQAIVDAGLTDFYQFRTENAPTGQVLVPEFLQQTSLYDNPALQKRFVREEGEHIREAALILEGITCAACVWLNERHLRHLPGVLDVQVNYTTHRAWVRWDNSQIQLSEILQAVSQIGYLAHLYDPTQQQALLDKERKTQLQRIGLAGVLGMQVMMFSVALYAGDWWGMEAGFKAFFYWINLVLTIPILTFSAEPFFKSAWRDLQHRQVGMDVPVALAISLAFIGSVGTTLQLSPGGHVYYDSIAMFVFFLLTGRYFELMARQRAAQAAETLVHIVPTMATRLRQTAEGLQEELVLVTDLAVGDRVLIRPGEAIPADGVIVAGNSSVDESLLTGESYPIDRTIEQPVIAGTINIESPLQVSIEKVGEETVLSHILRLLERAQTEKPAITRLADHVAAWFVSVVLVLAVGVGFYWWLQDPNTDRWFAITLSVLVVTCPCALSLATPTALTAATTTLTRYGLLVTRGHALETLAKATHFVFDKTGTLTEGRLQLLSTTTWQGWSVDKCLQYALGLEQHSEHPIAQALRQVGSGREITGLTATEVYNQVGAGLQGRIDGETFFIGTVAFIQQNTQAELPLQAISELQQAGDTVVILASETQVYAAFSLGDSLRPGVSALIADLISQGKKVFLLSGDHQAAVQRVAQVMQQDLRKEDKAALTIGYELRPTDKLQQVAELQAQGAVVAMVGDGVNDAPVLTQAAVSIAMGSGTQVARASADMILLSEQLSHLVVGLRKAKQTLVIIRQNMGWAVGYNLIALPAAAMGYVTPWLAAIGMSLSSLLVVSNALRLLEHKKD